MCMMAAGVTGVMGQAIRNAKAGGGMPGTASGLFGPIAEKVNAAARENTAMRSELAALKAVRPGSTPVAPGAPAPLAAGQFGLSVPDTGLGNLFAGPKNQSSGGGERIIK